MKNIQNIIYLLSTVFFLGACSTYNYHTTKVEKNDFTQYQTYGWMPPVDSLSKNYYSNDIAQINILDAANNELEARGLRYSNENPDILFRYIAIVNNKSQESYAHYPYSRWGMGFYSPWYYRSSMHMYAPRGREAYRLGHIIIEARDRETDRVIWQARGSGKVNNPEKAINDLPEIIHGIMAQFPVPLRSGSGT